MGGGGLLLRCFDSHGVVCSFYQLSPVMFVVPVRFSVFMEDWFYGKSTKENNKSAKEELFFSYFKRFFYTG